MNLQPTDIIIRKTDGTETLWLSQRLVMEVCGISEGLLQTNRDRYKKSVRACDLAKSKEFLPDSGKAWRWAKTSNGFYYCLDNIPNRSPNFYKSKFGTEQDLREALGSLQEAGSQKRNEAVKMELKKVVKTLTNTEDVQYYEYEASVLFNPKKARELAKAKAWVGFIKNQYESGDFRLLGVLTDAYEQFKDISVKLLMPMLILFVAGNDQKGLFD